ncbi:MAG: PilZ domain-containing protein [Planctomycetota bacterium]|nr:PilZ domain-containing protein [Planctomycetota bacterium]
MEECHDRSALIALRRAMAAAMAEERRNNTRFSAYCHVTVRWHHELGDAKQYEALDLSETGIRIRTDGVLPEGLTGRVRWSSGNHQEEDRPLMVVWSRPIHSPEGDISHFEAGLRLF